MQHLYDDEKAEPQHLLLSRQSVWRPRRKFVILLGPFVVLLVLFVGLGAGLSIPSIPRVSGISRRDYPTFRNVTADTAQLKTWWHPTGEINRGTPVGGNNVRQSHLYAIQISADDGKTYYDSFVYESIPRSGKGKACEPKNLGRICDEGDGITIEADVGVSMAWTQFLYSAEVVVKVNRMDGSKLEPGSVTLRPTYIQCKVRYEGDTVLVTVPYTPGTNGARFSLEFADDMLEYHNAHEGTTSHYVQNVEPSAPDYVAQYTSSMPLVGVEPRSALLIFASPFPAAELVPNRSGSEVQLMPPGRVQAQMLNVAGKSIVYFGPGVYDCDGVGRLDLGAAVRWLYLAPGSYVKCAVNFSNNKDGLRATGFGVLSGEQYVYQANVARAYTNVKTDDSLKMWQGQGVRAGQSFRLQGITLSAAPFNSMDFYGDTDHFSCDISDYKQVGSFYTQTDGPQMYPNSRVRDVFYHTGDDSIKMYYSNVQVERAVVWKTNNGPIVQLGWYPRDVVDSSVTDLDIIHSRYYSSLDFAPRAIIGSSSHYSDIYSTDTADTTKTISNFRVTNLRAEGIQPNLLSLNMLTNLHGFRIENAWIEKLSPATCGVSIGVLKGFTGRGTKVQIIPANGSPNGLIIKNYRVGDSKISFPLANWDAEKPGGFYVDEAYWGRWTIET